MELFMEHFSGNGKYFGTLLKISNYLFDRRKKGKAIWYAVTLATRISTERSTVMSSGNRIKDEASALIFMVRDLYVCLEAGTGWITRGAMFMLKNLVNK